MGFVGGAARGLAGIGGFLALLEALRRPDERQAVETARSIQAPPGTLDCWQVGRRPLDVDVPGIDFLADLTKNLERFNFNHVHLYNRGKGKNVGLFSDGLRSEDDPPKPVTFDTKFGGICMDADLIEEAMRHVPSGPYSVPDYNCQDYPDRLLEWVRNGWDYTAGGGRGGGGGGGI